MNQEQQHALNVQLTNTLIKLERDIERHRGERQYHIRRTNQFVKIGVLFLLIMGVFNVYHVWGFYTRMQEIVHSIIELVHDVTVVSNNMVHLTTTMQKFDVHMTHMQGINNSAITMSKQLPQMNQSLQQMVEGVSLINQDVGALNRNVEVINQRYANITRGINTMGSNVNQLATPMGMFNPMMP